MKCFQKNKIKLFSLIFSKQRFASMSDSVIKVTNISTKIDRIHTEKDFNLDIYKPAFSCNEGDVINILISDKTRKSDYMMSGHVYYVDETTSCISAGGLLCSVPQVLSLYSNVYICVKKSKKTKRDTDTTKI